MKPIALFILFILIAAVPATALAQLDPSSVPRFGMQSFDPQSVGPAAPQQVPVSTMQGRPQAPDLPVFSPSPFPASSFEIANEFDYTIYFSLGDGWTYYPFALGPGEVQSFSIPPGQSVIAAIDTNGEYQSFQIQPGRRHHVWSYQGYYVITP